MRVLIIYATNSGGAQAVSEIVADVLAEPGHEVEVRRASEPSAEEWSGFDLIILGSCTWERIDGDQRLEGQLQQHMYALTKRLRAQKWPGQSFAVFGLGDSSYTDFCAAADHLESFVRGARGNLIVPSLRIDGFFFNLPAHRELARAWATKLATAAARK